jgi:hypothetical protein
MLKLNATKNRCGYISAGSCGVQNLFDAFKHRILGQQVSKAESPITLDPGLTLVVMPIFD